MMKSFIILNLLFALACMPVAQAFAIPIISDMHQESETMDMSHCTEMNNGICGEKADCLSSGMLCIDGLSSALLSAQQHDLGHFTSTTLTNPNFEYSDLFPPSILRPPRNS